MKERESKPLAEFVKITKIGQTIAGKMTRYSPGTEGNSPFVVFEPAFLREEVGGKWTGYGNAAFGLSTDIARKADAKDVGKWLLFQFHDTEPTNKGGVKKLFKVYELDAAEVTALQGKAGLGAGLPAFATPEREPGEDDSDSDLI